MSNVGRNNMGRTTRYNKTPDIMEGEGGKAKSIECNIPPNSWVGTIPRVGRKKKKKEKTTSNTRARQSCNK